MDAKIKDKYVVRVVGAVAQKVGGALGFTPSESLSLLLAKELGLVSREKGRYGGTSVNDNGLKFLFRDAA
jgi:hypothetical protein